VLKFNIKLFVHPPKLTMVHLSPSVDRTPLVKFPIIILAIGSH